MDLSFITYEPAEAYHARSQSGEYMSSHMLATFRESPELYHLKVIGAVESPETPAMTFGRAAHTLIIEGRDAFDNEYIIADGPINSKTGETFGKTTKAYARWVSEQEKTVISPRDFDFLVKLQQSVWLHPLAGDMLKDGIAEGVVRADYFGVPCQIRMDFFSPLFGLIDLKTCDELKWFESDVYRYKYIHQMAFYRAVLRKIIGRDVDAYLIAVEKKEPNACGVWKISYSALDSAELTNAAVLEHYRACLENNTWPTGYEQLRILGGESHDTL